MVNGRAGIVYYMQSLDVTVKHPEIELTKLDGCL